MATIKTIFPSTNKIVCEVPQATIEDARTVFRQSQDAFNSFKDTPFSDRRSIVVKALALIQERKMDLGRDLSEQMGRPISYSHKEIETMQKRADYLLDIAEEALASLPGRSESGFKRWIKKVPVGPTLVIFAWNVRNPIKYYGLSSTLLAVPIPHHRQCPYSSSFSGE